MSYITSSLVTSCDNYVLDGQKPRHKSHNQVTKRDLPLDSRLKQPRKVALSANNEHKGKKQDSTAKDVHGISHDNLKIQGYNQHGVIGNRGGGNGRGNGNGNED